LAKEGDVTANAKGERMKKVAALPEAIPSNESARGNDFLSLEQLAEMLGVSVGTIRNWRRRGLLPTIELPGARRIIFDRQSVRDALLRRQRGGAQ